MRDSHDDPPRPSKIELRQYVPGVSGDLPPLRRARFASPEVNGSKHHRIRRVTGWFQLQTGGAGLLRRAVIRQTNTAAAIGTLPHVLPACTPPATGTLPRSGKGESHSIHVTVRSVVGACQSTGAIFDRLQVIDAVPLKVADAFKNVVRRATHLSAGDALRQLVARKHRIGFIRTGCAVLFTDEAPRAIRATEVPGAVHFAIDVAA